MPGPGKGRALPFFPANNAFPRSCPSLSLDLFYFHNVSQTQAKGITLQCTSPRKEFTFSFFAPWFLTQICHQTINSTLLICSTKMTSIFHKKFKFIFFLTISTKKIPLHKLCTFIFLRDFFWNYIKIWCYLLTLFFYYYFLFSFH